MPYIDEALFVSEQQVPEEAGLGHVSQLDHVVNTLHRCRVHDPEGGLQLLGQTLLLEEVKDRNDSTLFKEYSRLRMFLCCVMSHVDILILHYSAALMFTFPSSLTSNRWPDGVTLTRAPMGTSISESTQTQSP